MRSSAEKSASVGPHYQGILESCYLECCAFTSQSTKICKILGCIVRSAHLRRLLQHSLLEGLQDLRGAAARIVQILGASHLLHQKLHPLLRALRLMLSFRLGSTIAVREDMAVCFCRPCSTMEALMCQRVDSYFSPTAASLWHGNGGLCKEVFILVRSGNMKRQPKHATTRLPARQCSLSVNSQ